MDGLGAPQRPGVLHEEKGGPAGALDVNWREGGQDISSHESNVPAIAGPDPWAIPVVRVCISCYCVLIGI